MAMVERGGSLDVGAGAFTVDAAAAHASILIVDDHPPNLLALEALLAPLGHRLVKAQSGDEALKQIVDDANAIIRRIAEEEKFDAVFVEAAYANPGIDITAKVIKALDAAR